MNPVLAEIIDVLNVETLEENLFRGRHPRDSQHVFGGQVLAQAISSAYRTVGVAEARLHSVHAYFLRPGDWTRPILYEVDRIRDGGSFTTRRVVATQYGKAIFSLSSSWQRMERGLEHSVPMPDVPSPASLRTDKDVFSEIAKTQPHVRRFSSRFDAIDSRQVENIRMGDPVVHPPYKHTWMKTQERLSDDPELHLCMLAYMSDLDFMSTSLQPHARNPGPDGNIQGASLDHALWFHRPFRADEWLLFAKSSPSASGARGFVRGQFFNEAGELVATAAQECLIRVRG
jgi:acyl-CoA thioesterase-2